MYRRFRSPSLWRELDRMQREMNRLFDGYSPRTMQQATSYPLVNLWADEESVLLKAEVPGVKGEDLEISIEENTLIISGERIKESMPENGSYHRRERGAGKFTRSINLPFRVPQDKVEAEMKNGILTVKLPRAEEDKPKKINVKS